MLRRFLAVIVTFALCLGVVLAAEFKGKVKKVVNEEKKKQLVVEDGDKKETFGVGGKKVKFTAGDKEIKLEDIKEGDEVTVVYEEKENKKDATKKNKVVSEVKVKK